MLEIESRGKDATGFAFIDNEKITIAKEPGPATQFFTKNEFDIGRIYIGHTRAATHGTAAYNINNHPLIGKQFVLVHNGVVRMSKLDKYEYSGECDSEILLSYLETMGIEKGLENIDGSAAVAFLDRNANLYLFRHTSPIQVCLFYTKSGKKQFVFASTEDAIVNSIKNLVPVNEFDFLEAPVGEMNENTLYKITPDLKITSKKIEIKQKTYNYQNNYSYPYQNNYGAGYWANYRNNQLPFQY